MTDAALMLTTIQRYSDRCGVDADHDEDDRQPTSFLTPSKVIPDKACPQLDWGIGNLVRWRSPIELGMTAMWGGLGMTAKRGGLGVTLVGVVEGWYR